jgi:hypothetical protein
VRLDGREKLVARRSLVPLAQDGLAEPGLDWLVPLATGAPGAAHGQAHD